MSSRREGSQVSDLLKQLCSQQLSSFGATDDDISRAYQQCCRLLDSKPFNIDEHSVHEGIKKKLLSSKGYNIAQGYTDVYEKLTSLGGPKKRTSVLHFLSLLNSHKAGVDTVALVQPQIQKSTETPAVSSRLVVNRDPNARSVQDSLITPRYASAVVSSDSFEYYTEADLIKDILFVCQGIETRAIVWDPTRMAFVPSTGIPLPRNKLDQACKLAELGFLYKTIKMFIDQRLSEKSYGLIGQAFCSALTSELQEYYRLISILDNQNFGGKLSLNRVVVWTSDAFDRLQLLASLCSQVGIKNGGKLTSCFYMFLHHGDPDLHNLVSKILHLSTRPLREMLRRWIYEGDCYDAYGEFFITVDCDVPQDSLWESKYSLNLDMLPSFISKKMAERILLIGKTINFIRVVCRDHTTINFPFSSVATDSQGLNDIVGPELHGLIAEVDRTVSAYLIELLKTKYLLCEHLTAIRDYLLLGQGDFVQHLMDLIAKDLSNPANTLVGSALQSKLETAQRASNAQFHHFEVIKCVRVVKLEQSTGDVGWDVFTVDYELDGPLTVIVNQDCRETYLCIFRMLWKAKRIEHGLGNVWATAMMWRRTLPFIQKEINSFRHLINTIVQEFQHFINQLQYYVNFEVLECSWKDLENAVNTAQDLDCIIEAHKIFVNLVSERLMLNEEHKGVLELLYKLFNIIINFISDFETANAYMKDYNLLCESRSDTKAGTGGVADQSSFVDKINEYINDFNSRYKCTFLHELKVFLDELSSLSDDALSFLSLRIDFNEIYQTKTAKASGAPYITKARSLVPGM